MIFVTKVIDIKFLVDDKKWIIQIVDNVNIWTFYICNKNIYEKFIHARWKYSKEPLLVIKTDEDFNILKGILLTPLEIEGIDLEKLLDSV